jgi:hypothetical protein
MMLAVCWQHTKVFICHVWQRQTYAAHASLVALLLLLSPPACRSTL